MNVKLNQSNLSKYNAKINFCGIETKVVQMSEQINKLITLLKNAQNYDEVTEIMQKSVQNEDIEKMSNIAYRCGDYIIEDLLRHNGESNAKILEQLTKKNIKIAPTYIDSVNIGDYTILITKVDGMQSKDLIPFSKGYSSLSDEAKKEAFADIKKMANAGLVNQQMLRGDYAWYIVPATKKVVIPSWNGLRPIGENERSDVLQTCYKTIFRK